MENGNINVGDKIYVRRFGSWNWFYSPVEVVKKTTSGMIDVQFYPDGPLKRFRANGKEVGKNDEYELDDIPFTERAAKLAAEERAKEAADAIRRVQGSAKGEWGKAHLLEEVERLQGLLNIAREAVESI
jgi:hypothetical protein